LLLKPFEPFNAQRFIRCTHHAKPLRDLATNISVTHHEPNGCRVDKSVCYPMARKGVEQPLRVISIVFVGEIDCTMLPRPKDLSNPPAPVPYAVEEFAVAQILHER
jgi:hypothetical protein